MRSDVGNGGVCKLVSNVDEFWDRITYIDSTIYEEPESVAHSLNIEFGSVQSAITSAVLAVVASIRGPRQTVGWGSIHPRLLPHYQVLHAIQVLSHGLFNKNISFPFLSSLFHFWFYGALG